VRGSETCVSGICIFLTEVAIDHLLLLARSALLVAMRRMLICSLLRMEHWNYRDGSK
jgi:hypothetical protein